MVKLCLMSAEKKKLHNTAQNLPSAVQLQDMESLIFSQSFHVCIWNGVRRNALNKSSCAEKGKVEMSAAGAANKMVCFNFTNMIQ